MKNFIKLFGIIALTALIVFSFTACGGNNGDDNSVTIGSTSGSITIEGLDDFKGKWVIAMGFDEEDEDMDMPLIMAADIQSNGNMKGALINNQGKATLKVWKVINDTTIGNYNGNDEIGLMIMILNKQNVTEDEMYSGGGSLYAGMGIGFVEFSNGKGTCTFMDDDFDF